jgi:hypothetical protein
VCESCGGRLCVGVSVAVGVMVDANVNRELSAVLNRAHSFAVFKSNPSKPDRAVGCAADTPSDW